MMINYYYKLLIVLDTIVLVYLLSKVGKSRYRRQRTQLILTVIINKTKIKILSMELQTKQFLDTILDLVDHETQQPIDATFSDVQLTSSDESIFTSTSDVNGDGTVDVVGVGEGTAVLNVKVMATYIDSKLNQEVTNAKEVNVDVTITAPPPEAETTDLVVTFSDPKPVPEG